MISDKWIHSTIREMQVSDSIRYREAVTRLKRLLYDSHYKSEPATMKSQNERKNYTQKLTESFEKEEEEKDISQDLETSTSSGIIGMVKQQDELITQLEKENNFLKAEMVSTIEASKEITLQNEEFRRRLTNTLAQMEVSPDMSLQSEGQEKVQEIMNCLKDEREHLMEGLKLQEETIAALRKREIDALDKVKQAIELAEDSQKLSVKAKDTSESSRAELQTQLQIFHDQLLATQKQLKRAKDREKENEKIILDQERRLAILQDEKKNMGMLTSQKEMELAKKVRELDMKFRDSESDKHRLEKLLLEQKKTSETTLKRLEALLDRRNHEAESFLARRSSLEKQIRDAKDENLKLIEAVNELAKERGQRTDNDKIAQQMVPLPLQTREEINEIKSTVRSHQDSIISLQSAVSSVREEMVKGMDDLRGNLEELCSTMKGGKVDAEDGAGVSSNKELQKEILENNVVSNEPLPQSSRSEGYDSLSESTQPSLKLVERKAKTEHIEDPSLSNGFDHAFSKIIVPLPRKAKQCGTILKVKESELEPKDIDETETKDAAVLPTIAGHLRSNMIPKNEERVVEGTNISRLEVLKESEAVAEEISEDRNEEGEAVERENQRKVEINEENFSSRNSPNVLGNQALSKNEEYLKIADVCEDLKNKPDQCSDTTTEASSDAEPKESEPGIEPMEISADSDSKLGSADHTVPVGSTDLIEGSLPDNLNEESFISNSNKDPSTEDVEQGYSKEDIATNEPSVPMVALPQGESKDPEDESLNGKSKEESISTISKDHFTGVSQFENMDDMDDVAHEFETIEEDVNSSEETSLNVVIADDSTGKVEPEALEMKESDVAAKLETLRNVEDPTEKQKIDENVASDEVEKLPENTETLPEITTNITKPADLTKDD